MKVEQRMGTCGVASSRTNTKAGTRAMTGYAARYGSVTVIGEQFREVIERGAFTQALTRSDPRCLVNHDANALLARQSAGTLTLTEDARGLKYRAELPDTQPARDLYENLRRRNVRESSFAFTVAKDLWELPTQRGGLPLRRIVEIDQLFDVSPVTYPAYAATSAEAEDGARKERSAVARECAAVVGSIGDALRVRKVLEARASARVCARCQARLGTESCVIGTARRFDVVCPVCAEHERLRSRRAAMTATTDGMARRRAELARRERALRA